MSKRLGSKTAAAHIGIAYSTWRSLLARGKGPRPDGIDEGFGKPYWSEDTLDAWKDSRPGQGARTDLRDRVHRASE